MDQGKLTEQVEVVVASDSQNSAEESVNNSNVNKKRGVIESVIGTISDSVARQVNPSQQGTVRVLVQNVLRTVTAMCAEDEYALGLRVKDELYRYNEYSGPAGLTELLVAKRVVVSDVPSAKDFLDRKKYAMQGDVLTPSRFAEAIKQIRKALRVNSEDKAFSRPDLTLLGEATKYAVNGGKVVDRTQKSIYFLSITCDEESRIPIQDWARSIAITLFE